VTTEGTFPEFLRPAFDEAALTAVPETLCAIDPAGSILWVNAAWHAFAAANGAGEKSRSWTSYFDPIPAPLRAFYENAFRHALEHGDVFEHDYECSSPDEERLFHLRLLPIDGRGLLIEHTLLGASVHGIHPEAGPAADYTNEHGLVAQCANCRRVRHPSGAFHWVPSWVASPPLHTSHVVCIPCAGFYWGRPRRRHRR
jgi:PAS domain-containing protein